MYRLYFKAGTAAFGPQAVLEEAGLAHELVTVDTSAGAHRQPDYLALNPTGKIPTLVTPEGEVLYETAAIMLYLADRHGLDDLAPPVGHPLRGLFYRSLFFLSNVLQTDFKRYYYPERFTNDASDAPGIKAKAQATLKESWRLLEAQLAAAGPYHLGARFSLADIYLVMLATWYEPLEELLNGSPAVARCCGLVAARPAVRRCLEQHGGMALARR